MRSANPLDAWIADRIGNSRNTFSRSELLDYQFHQLRETVAWAQRHSPFYRQGLNNIDAETLTKPDDLRRLPFTTAEDLRRNNPPLLCVSQSEISHVVTLDTSGTSGAPKRLFFTTQEQEATLDFFHHGMKLPARAGERVLILFPGDRPGSVGELLARALERLGASTILAGWPQDPAAIAALLRRERPDVVAGAPVPMLAVARHSVVPGLPPIHIKRVLLSSDHAANSLRHRLAGLWNCEIFEHYGMTEMGLGGGVDCEAHAGYHMRENELLIEVVAPGSDDSVSDGEPGEIVLTTLTRRGLPLIRYRTGDFSRMVPGACACGSPLTRLERIHGRVAGGVRLGENGNLTMAALDESLFALDDIADFNVRLVPGTPLMLQVEIVRVNREAAGSARLLASVRSALEGIPLIQAVIARQELRLSLTISPHGNLIRRSGKRHITSEASP